MGKSEIKGGSDNIRIEPKMGRKNAWNHPEEARAYTTIRSYSGMLKEIYLGWAQAKPLTADAGLKSRLKDAGKRIIGKHRYELFDGASDISEGIIYARSVAKALQKKYNK